MVAIFDISMVLVVFEFGGAATDGESVQSVALAFC
jgi:hypothetical protein